MASIRSVSGMEVRARKAASAAAGCRLRHQPPGIPGGPDYANMSRRVAVFVPRPIVLNLYNLPLGGDRINDQHVRVTGVGIGDVEVIFGRSGLSDLDDHIDVAVSVHIRTFSDLLFKTHDHGRRKEVSRPGVGCPCVVIAGTMQRPRPRSGQQPQGI